MHEGDFRTRRAFLVAAGMSVSAMAGCSSDDTDDPSGTETTTQTSDGTTKHTTADEGNGDDVDLDLREANVVDVTVESTGEGEYQFDVTLYHDDDGEAGYADWWQVERLDGTQLGRRPLAHAHGTQRFTRSSAIEIPTDVTCVVVRGHDQTHEYGGQVFLVDLETGNSRAIRQGNDPEAFIRTDCP